MPEQTITQRLGKYEVYEVEEDKIFSVYRIRNKGENESQRRIYVLSNFVIDRAKSDDIQIGNFKSICDKHVNYDTVMFHIGDSTVRITPQDENTNIIIYNTDIEKRRATKSILEKILA